MLPALFIQKSGSLIQIDYVDQSGACYLWNHITNSSFGGPSSFIGVWIYFAFEMHTSLVYSFAVFSAASPYVQAVTPQPTLLKKWSTLGFNQIKLTRRNNYACTEEFKFKDVRV
jgi:hypothetical protein